MKSKRCNLLCIGGFDPSAGAGVIADSRAGHARGCYVFSVCTAITVQTEDAFYALEWLDSDLVCEQVTQLLACYSIHAVKIGLIESLAVATRVVSLLRAKLPDIAIVWDPVLSASAGFTFHSQIATEQLEALLLAIDIVTPNERESMQLLEALGMSAALASRKYEVSFVVTGAREENVVVDSLYQHGEQVAMFRSAALEAAKHGSGCVYSTTLAAGLAHGLSAATAAQEAQKILASYLVSSASGLGIHSHELQVGEFRGVGNGS